MGMRRLLMHGAAAALLLLFSGQAFALTIVGSKHDLSIDQAVVLEFDVTWGVGGNSRICVFCHTPHGAATSLQQWNRTMPGPGGYTSYGNPQGTMDATPPGTVWGDALGNLQTGSLACLSCHDGSVALDDLVDFPNPWPDATAVTFAGTKLTTEMLDSDSTSYIGTDMSASHPVGFRYTTAEAPTDPGIRASTAGTPDYVTDGTNTINLYDNGTDDDYVACATCHNAHDPGTAAAGTAPFLKMSNTDSDMCLVCHIK